MLDYLGGKMKTPEEMAEELDRQAVLYVSLKARNDVSYYVGMDCYKAGYKAAAAEYQEKLNQLRLERPAFKKHEIENHICQANADGYKRGYERGLIARNDWISVEEKLPEKDKRVLWYNPTLYSPIVVDSIAPDWNGRLENNTYTHWQELPEPPKEEE
jgi:hypothetical protein